MIQNRQIGFPLRFENTNVEYLITKKDQIFAALKEHGCICLKGLNFAPIDMLNFTLGVFGNTFSLNPGLAFNNQDPVHKQVTRVGNINADGTIKNSMYEAAYWHQDGDFYRPNQNKIFNILHTKVEPETGGDTWIMDLVKAHNFVKQKYPELFQKLKKSCVKVDLLQIKDFKDVKDPSTINTDQIVFHQMVTKTSFQDKQCLYLSGLEYVDKQDTTKLLDINQEELTGLLEKEMGYYAHKWQTGDILIWDNVQVLHRSSGKFTGKRLLFRTQSRLK